MQFPPKLSSTLKCHHHPPVGDRSVGSAFVHSCIFDFKLKNQDGCVWDLQFAAFIKCILSLSLPPSFILFNRLFFHPHCSLHSPSLSQILLCGSGWPQTREPSASSFQVLGWLVFVLGPTLNLFWPRSGHSHVTVRLSSVFSKFFLRTLDIYILHYIFHIIYKYIYKSCIIC